MGGWDGSIMFTSRGCVNRCPFCLVPRLEGGLRTVLKDPFSHIHPDHTRVILWDNNFLALPDWDRKIKLLSQCGKWVDFNQGLDARLMTEEKAEAIAALKIKDVKMAYDGGHEKNAVHRAVDMLEGAGFSRRRISFYTLYMGMGCASYPVRYVPLMALTKNGYISPRWTAEQLESVAKARLVIGFGGSFPPYKALVDKFGAAGSFDEAFHLEPPSAGNAKAALLRNDVLLSGP